VSFVFAYAGLLGIVVQSGLGRLVRRFGEPWLVAAGFASMAVGYGLLAGTYMLPLLLVAGVFSAFGNGVLRPSLTTLITHAVARNEQGVVLGLNTSLQSVAQIVATAVAGLLLDRQLLASWALFCAGCAVVGLLVQRTAQAPGKTAAARGRVRGAAEASRASTRAPTLTRCLIPRRGPSSVEESRRGV
jgi:MFS family permease